MTSKIANISIDAKSLVRSERNKNARDRAITDLLDDNKFQVGDYKGPFTVNLEVVDSKFFISIIGESEQVDTISIPISSLRRVIKDYHIICESYYDAIKTADSRRVEAIDMGRRGVHNEGAEILEEFLQDKITSDFETYRKLFALLYVLQIK